VGQPDTDALGGGEGLAALAFRLAAFQIDNKKQPQTLTANARLRSVTPSAWVEGGLAVEACDAGPIIDVGFGHICLPVVRLGSSHGRIRSPAMPHADEKSSECGIFDVSTAASIRPSPWRTSMRFC
jgi:hypothetical protein